MAKLKSKNIVNGIWQVLLITSSVLLAFAINSWNEQRKEKISELEILKALHGAIELDLVVCMRMIKVIRSQHLVLDISGE